MKLRRGDIVFVGGLVLALWALYEVSPEAGRIGSRVLSVVTLVGIAARFVRSRQRS